MDIICSEKVPTVSFDEQIISKDKYPDVFSRQMESVVFIILHTFFAKSGFENWGKNTDNPQSLLENIHSNNELRSIAGEGKYLMDYNTCLESGIVDIQV